MKITLHIALIMSVLITSSCGKREAKLPATGVWKGELDLGAEKLPFLFEIVKEDTTYRFNLLNGEETLRGGTLERGEDSIKLEVPVFDTWFIAAVDENGMAGHWYNNPENEIIPFSAVHDVNKRFEYENSPGFNITGRWEAGFYNPPGEDPTFTVSKALGIFEQSGRDVTGTFLTPTGDYRFLTGIVDGRNLKLSTFDGAHAYLFKGRFENNRLEGDFWSGIDGHKKWMAERNDQYQLPDAGSMTEIVTDKEVTFSFPDLDGNMVTYPSEKYNGKVVIVQVMGSWCPNCMDETAFLARLHEENKEEGLEVIALAFEVTPDQKKAAENVRKLKKQYNADYDFLIAGTASKKEASEKLPFLSGVSSFPTTIFIDRKGNVASVHTGYTGPATGHFNKNFQTETEELINRLLN